MHRLTLRLLALLIQEVQPQTFYRQSESADWTFNLIDTPGHVDFGMEVESASRVIDGAVVLMDAVEGVEGQTLGVWRQLDRHDVPTRLIFLNKLDRPGASLRSSIRSILANRLHPSPLLLTLPVASFDAAHYNTGEPGVKGIVDLVNWEVWQWNMKGELSRHPLPRTAEFLESSPIFPPSHPILLELLPAREALVDSLCLLSPALMSQFLSLPSSPSPYLSLSARDMLAALRQLTLDKSVLPVLCGAALRHVGTELALNYVGALLANPVDVHPQDVVSSNHGDVELLAWKVGWDKQRGWMTFVRVYSGTLTRQTMLYNTSSRQRERISKLVLLYASRPEIVESLPFGSVGVILGLKHTRTGDTLVSTAWTDKTLSKTATDKVLRNIVPPPSVISASVIPHSQSDVQPVKAALLALSRTDPSLRVTEDEEEGQTLVHGLGELHLEIVEGRLRDEWEVRCQFGKRRVSYRETLGFNLGSDPGPINVEERWEKDISGTRVGATVKLAVRPMTDKERESERSDRGWDGNLVVDTSGKSLPNPNTPDDRISPDSPLFPMLQGIANALSVSPHTGLSLSAVHVQDAGPGDVMEPYMRVKVDVPEESIGRVVKDLTENLGEILDLGSVGASPESGSGEEEIGYDEDGVYIPPAWMTPSSVSLSQASSTPQMRRSVHAVAPLSKMLRYSTRLRAASGGLGIFEMSVEGFRPVAEVRRMEILKEIGRA
ncbi:hypothetical protein BS47DRAFT_1382149 [Hydnum rufescens UP504]|uniref:Tr-type G domain-containing protein n=1 Tax=Hydnum rufescens UP504 TaxID=1448309 RepID=A0A9P6AY60_9AGAM|nr:hypothetical protein BS47DRAFT_1382149 [Hydnum rufescens UP504]